MLPQHVFSHQHQYSHDPSWQQQLQQQQQQPHHQQHPHHGQGQHSSQAQAQAAAAAAAAAQQQHYIRVAAQNNGNANGNGTPAQGDSYNTNFGGSTADQTMSAEERRVLESIAQLLNPVTREASLLELSKKREQFPQLALILWHTFGLSANDGFVAAGTDNGIVNRRHDFSTSRNNRRLPAPQPLIAHRRRFEPCV